MSNKARFVGYYLGEYTARGFHADGAPYAKGAPSHVIEIAGTEPERFYLAWQGMNIALWSLTPDHAVVLQAEQTLEGPNGEPMRVKILGGSVHLHGEEMSYTLASEITVSSDVIQGMMAFKGRRLSEGEVAGPVLH